jgi:hypothetical protein
LLSITLIDPIVRSYAHLRNFVLAVKVGAFLTLFCVLLPVIHRFGMMGAAVLAVAIQIGERLTTGAMAAKVVNAKLKDLDLYHDVFKIAGLTATAGLFAYFVRNLIGSAQLLPRILAVGISFSAIYLPSFYFMRLPGWQLMSRERIQSFVRNQLSKLKSETAGP